MLLAILLILDAALLGGLGWGLRKDQIKTEQEMRGWVAQPIPVKVSQYAVWKSAAQKKIYDYLEKKREESGKYIPQHRYVHP
jgi:hypothetical protein